MPTTSRGYPFEALGDAPTHTLNGGLGGLDPILAEAVNDDVDQVASDVATAEASITELRQRGWHDITPVGGTTINSATVFNVEAETCDMIRVYLRGSLTDAGLISLRVNSDTTSDLHRRNRIVRNMEDGSVDEAFATEGTSWFLAVWGTNVNNVAEATIFATDANNVITFTGGGYRNTPGESLRRITESNGALTSSRVLDSIQVLGSAGADIDSVRVWIEGHRT